MIFRIINYIFLAGILVNLITLFQRNRANKKLIATARVFNNDVLKDEKRLRVISLIVAILIGIVFMFTRNIIRDYNVVSELVEEENLGFIEMMDKTNDKKIKSGLEKTYEDSMVKLKMRIYYLLSLSTLSFLVVINSRARIEEDGFRIFNDVCIWESCKGYEWDELDNLVIYSKEGIVLVKLRFSRKVKLVVEEKIKELLVEL